MALLFLSALSLIFQKTLLFSILLETLVWVPGLQRFQLMENSPDEWKQHINIKELKSVLYAFLPLFRSTFSCSILIRSDNSIIVSYINKQGGTSCSILCGLALNCGNCVSTEVSIFWLCILQVSLTYVLISFHGLRNQIMIIFSLSQCFLLFLKLFLFP